MRFNNILIMKYLRQYQKASRKRKHEILNVLEETTKLHRKHLIRKLQTKRPYRLRKIGGSRSKYPKETIALLELVSKCSDYICGELLHPVIEEIIDYLKEKQLLHTFDETVINLVRNIPLGTLKAKLRQVKKPPQFAHSKYLSRSRSQLKRIVINTTLNKSKSTGFIELDFVDHNGGNSSGSFCRSLCSVDIFTQFISRYAVRGKKRSMVKNAFNRVLEHFPFKLKELHTDNEPNLIVSMILQQARQNEIKISRSRSYHKEDNGHVEQKNGDKIRKLVGYKRYDTNAATQLLNLLYACDDLIQNHFITSRRLIKKLYDQDNRLIAKMYDTAKTPYNRIIESEGIDQKQRDDFIALHNRLDRLDLIDKRDTLLKHLRSVQ